MLSDEYDDLNILCDKISSRNYWIFVTDSIDLLETVENLYYKPKTEANADFELTFAPGLVSIGLVSVALAHKRRMTYQQLHDIIAPLLDRKTMNYLDRRHLVDNVDTFVVSVINWELVYDMLFRLLRCIRARKLRSQVIGIQEQKTPRLVMILEKLVGLTGFFLQISQLTG